MNNDKPVQLGQKVDYLKEKIEFMYNLVRKSGVFESKMKFIDFIDTSIERIYALQGKKPYPQEVIRKKYQEYYSAEENHREKTRIETEKQQLSQRLRDLDERQHKIVIESLKLELENSRILKNSILKECSDKEFELKQYVNDLQKKIKAQEKQIERLIKMNSGQGRQIEILKEQRNKAEKRELQWRQRYQADIGVLQTYREKKNKYIYRHDEGLRVLRTLTNVTTDRKGCQRLFICDLPMKFHVIKIVYGIKVGMMQSNRDVTYFQEVSLYEKEEMQISQEDGQLNLVYLKRKVTLRLDKYKLPKNQVVIMLFGRGDSVAIDESQ